VSVLKALKNIFLFSLFQVVFPVEDFEPGHSSGTDVSFSKAYDLNSCVSHYGGKIF